jgi:hypothetical protein
MFAIPKARLAGGGLATYDNRYPGSVNSWDTYVGGPGRELMVERLGGMQACLRLRWYSMSFSLQKVWGLRVSLLGSSSACNTSHRFLPISCHVFFPLRNDSSVETKSCAPAICFVKSSFVEQKMIHRNIVW